MFLDKLVLKQGVDKKSIINAITCSTLKSPSAFYDDEMDNGVYKSALL